MSFRVGTATLKLNNKGRDGSKGKDAKQGQKKGKKSGKTAAVIKEAMDERAGVDAKQGGSIDHTRSHLNEYWVSEGVRAFASAHGLDPYAGETVCGYIDDQIATYDEEVYFPAHGQHVRSDAIQAIALAIKPPARVIQTWDEATRERFFALSLEYLDGAFGGADNRVCYAVHRDEGFEEDGVFYDGEHVQAFYMPWTEDGRLSAKEVHGPALWQKLNRGYPEFMREHGFDVETTEILDWEQMESILDDRRELEAERAELAAKAEQDASVAERIAELDVRIEENKGEEYALRGEAIAERAARNAQRGGLQPGAPAEVYRATQDALNQRQAAIEQRDAARIEAQDAVAVADEAREEYEHTRRIHADLQADVAEAEQDLELLDQKADAARLNLQAQMEAARVRVDEEMEEERAAAHKQIEREKEQARAALERVEGVRIADVVRAFIDVAQEATAPSGAEAPSPIHFALRQVAEWLDKKISSGGTHLDRLMGRVRERLFDARWDEESRDTTLSEDKELG